MLGLWFLEDGYCRTALQAFERFEYDQDRAELFIQQVSSNRDGGDLFVRDGSTAHIMIRGTLTKEPSFFFSMFDNGGTVYGDIVQAIQAADGDDEIEDIILEIDSPGGEAGGFFETAAAIAAATKPVEAQVTDLAASGAFGLAVQADRVIVNNPMAEVGSVGVVSTQFVSESRVTITSTEAPKKAPDAGTEEGVAAIRERLDAMHGEFVAVIAAGRGITPDKVNADFGRGAVLIADAALQAGMIDAIGVASTEGGRRSPASDPDTRTEASETMDLNELREKYPALCTAIHAEGHAAGIVAEHDRVSAHVEAGRGSPAAAELAAGFIVGGNNFSEQTVQARYMVAGQNTAALDDRAADDAAADAGQSDTPGVSEGEGSAVDADARDRKIMAEARASMGLGV